MRRRLGLLGVLAMLASVVVTGALPASASAGLSGPYACVNSTNFNFNVLLELTGGEVQIDEVRIFLNADAADMDDSDGDPYGDVSDSNTEAISIVIDTSGETPVLVFDPGREPSIDSYGTPLDRWAAPLVVDISPGPPDSWIVHLDTSHGVDRFQSGDSIAQVYMEFDEVFPEETFTATQELGSVPVEPCPGTLTADLESSTGSSGYLVDATTLAEFAFVGTTSSFEPSVTNNGPDDEGDARMSWALDLVGSTTNVDDGSHAVIDTHFEWSPVLPCQPVNTGTIGFRPTISCGFGSIPAGGTVTGEIGVLWLLPGDYFVRTRATSSDNLTVDIDPSNNEDSLDFAVIDPVDDADTDGIDNGVDGSASGWDPFTASSSFDDAYWGGGTSGTILSGMASVADAASALDGVSVVTPTTGGATLDACGSQVALGADTDVTITCGSITVSVLSGSAEVTLEDGTTLVLDGGDTATVDATEVTVTEGSAEISDGGQIIDTVDAGETYTVPQEGADADGDGVPDTADACPDTTAEDQSTFELKKNHYYLADTGDFVDLDGEPSGITVEDTGGCSATQIIEAAELGKGHERFGITMSALLDWIAGLNG